LFGSPRRAPAREPDRCGWTAQTHFTATCTSLALDGCFVLLEDLVLHDAGMDIHTPTRDLGLARHILATRRRGSRLGAHLGRPRQVSAQAGELRVPVDPEPDAEDFLEQMR
jgi:hypothetical protein